MILTDKACLQSQALSEFEVPKRRKRKRRIKLSSPFLLGLVACAILALALVYVGQRTHLMTVSYQLDALERQIAQQLREQEFLKLQIVQAHSLAHVEQVATTHLGMVRPESRQFVVLDTDRVDSYQGIHDEPLERGLIAIAVDWVSRHWPRMGTAEAGGEGR